MSRKNIFVLGNDSINGAKLEELSANGEYAFHWLLDYDYIHSFRQIPMSQITETARKQLREFPDSIDALICLWDFPGCLLGPLLCAEFALVGPDPGSVFKCENKYLSRIEQRKVIPECCPDFHGFNPHQDDLIGQIPLEYPFWIKPVTGFSGHLGFLVQSEQGFIDSMKQIESRLDIFTRPYLYLEQQFEADEQIRQAGKTMFIAEQIIGGKQCTLEGYVFQGDFSFHGIIDSFRYPNRMSFARYEYPSVLSRRTKLRMCEKAEKIMRQVGFDNGTFNIEFFYDRRTDKLWLLEINTRISQSHCDLFRWVDGRGSHQIAVDVALGRQPEVPQNQGKFNVAAKLFLRSFSDGTVTKAPDKKLIEQLEDKYEAIIQVTVENGMRLSQLKWQDSYSFVLVIAYMASQSRSKLLEKFDNCANELGIEVDGKKIRSKQRRKV